MAFIFRKPLVVMSSLWIFVLLVSFVRPSLLATHPVTFSDTAFAFDGPSGEHFFGRGQVGEDLYSFAVYGGQNAVRSILIAVGIGALLGVPLGLLSAWKGGRADRTLMWIVDLLFSIPVIMLAISIVAILGSGVTGAMVGVGFAMVARFARITRAACLAEKEELYIDAARISGIPSLTTMRRYIFPNLIPTLVVQVSILSSIVILIGTGLSVIGVGAGREDADWGSMILRASENSLSEGYWLFVPACLPLLLTILSLNLLGDAIRDSYVPNGSVTSLGSSQRLSPAGNGAGEYGDDSALFSVNRLSVEFPAAKKRTPKKALHDISFSVNKGEVLGVVGESGSGKSIAMLASVGLLPAPGRTTQGTTFFDGTNLTAASEKQWQKIRGNEIGYIFQEPVASLNPALTVGQQLVEPLLIHTNLTRKQAWKKAEELLAEVRIPDPASRVRQYPHEFSGGMAQRVGIALALACEPKLLIADEPTTALDVTVQGQILDLLSDIQARRNMAIIFVSHDLGVIAEIADHVMVMYAGQVVEQASAESIFSAPAHPYTQALLATMPQNHSGGLNVPLTVIEGTVPSEISVDAGCQFAPRCRHVQKQCSIDLPELTVIGMTTVACMRAEELQADIIDLTPTSPNEMAQQ